MIGVGNPEFIIKQQDIAGIPQAALWQFQS